MRSKSKVVVATVAMLMWSGLSPAAADQYSRPRPATKHQLVLTGTWVQPGCVPNDVPTVNVEDETAGTTCVGAAAYAGDLTGYATQHITASSSAEGTTARIIADIYARTKDNLCGTLRLEPEKAFVAAPDVQEVAPNATGVGPIISGTGDFEGVTGWYDTDGYVAAGFGGGDYTITLDFRGQIPVASALPCVPPPPEKMPS